MQKTKKILAIGLGCLIFILCIFFVECKKEETTTPTTPTYECTTCKDEGVINCPNCHVKKCDYKNGGLWCKGGTLFKKCNNCDGDGYIGYRLCSNCLGDGYDSKGYKCNKCSYGYEKVDCPKCFSDGTTHSDGTTNGWESCPQCRPYFIGESVFSLCGGEPCMQCEIPSNTTINNGYSYIDCPDCE